MSTLTIEPCSLIRPPAKPAEFVEPLNLCLAAYGEHPADAAVLAELRQTCHAAAAAIAELHPGKKQGEEVDAVRTLLKAVAASGVWDRPVDGEDLTMAGEFAEEKTWPGLLAAMLLVPAWQWPGAPALAVVPLWLWADYVAYLFHVPQGFCAVGHAESYAAHNLRRLEELVRMAEPARGSAAVRDALNAYAQTANTIPLYFAPGSLRRHAELRGRLLHLLFGVRENPPLLPLPRDGRRLRVGFVNRHFSPQTETYTTLPTFEQLDPARFEVLLFAHAQTYTPLERYCRSRAGDFQILPATLPEQVALLRAAALDVVVFGTNVTAVVNEVTQLALHRLAPLQVVNNSSCITSGLPEIDLYVSGDQTEAAGSAAHFTERLGLLPGPAHAFNYAADPTPPALTFTRADLGIPADAMVFASAANYFKVIPEMREAWARLLAAVPNSYLLLHPFNPNWSSRYPVRRFQSEMEQALAAHGVAARRLVLSTARFPSRTDVKGLLALGDVYLDTFPFGGVNSLVDPLEAGVPVVAWEGDTMRSRMGAALLRQLGLPELIATDEAGYAALAGRLAGDAAARAGLRARINEAMSSQPLFLDSLAASDAFGELLILAHDELLEKGAQTFRRTTVPVAAEKVPDGADISATVNYLLELGMTDEAARHVEKVLAGDPAQVEARHLMGKVQLARNRVERAAEYLLAAINRGTAGAPVWRDLAATLRRAGNRAGATTALETALRLDQADAESWFLLAELARECGHRDILLGVAEMTARLAPDDPRTARVAAECTRSAPPVAP